MMTFENVTKRELRKILRAAWAQLGHDAPARSFFPPVDGFLDQLQGIWEAYLELEGDTNGARIPRSI
jgi:hypothetical protein